MLVGGLRTRLTLQHSFSQVFCMTLVLTMIYISIWMISDDGLYILYRFISPKNQLSDTSNTFFMSVTVQSQSALLQRNTQTHICPPQARNFYISDDFTLGNHIFLLHRTFETSNFPRPYRGETLGAVIYEALPEKIQEPTF